MEGRGGVQGLGPVAICLVLVLVAAGARAQEAIVFSPAVRLSPPSAFESAYLNDLAISGSEVRATWVGRTTSGAYRWGYSVSHDGGRTFESHSAPSGYGEWSVVARVVALSEGRFAYVWSQYGQGVTAMVEEPDGTVRTSGFLGYYALQYLDIDADDTGVYVAWIDFDSNVSRVMVGEFDPLTLQLTRSTVVDTASNNQSNVRLSVYEGVIGITWNAIDWSYGTAAVMFSHATTDLNASAPRSVSGSSYPEEGLPTVSMGPGGLAFVAFGNSYSGGAVRAWTALPPDYSFQSFPNFETTIGSSRVDDLAAEFDAQGRLLLVWVDGPSDSISATVRFTRASSSMSGFLPPTDLDANLGRMKGGLAVAANEAGRAYAAWSTFLYGSDSDVHVAREFEPPPPPASPPLAVVLGPLGIGVAGSAGVVLLLRRRSRRRPRPE